MEHHTVITHRLELALRLLDTASGQTVSGQTVEVLGDGKPLRGGEKPDGTLVFQNLGLTKFTLTLRSPDYEPMTHPVDLAQLDPSLPLLELHLIPGPHYRAAPLHTLAGVLPGITELSAVREGDNACLIRAFDARKRRMTICNPHHLELERTHYALVDPDAGTYEPFRILSHPDPQTLNLDRALETVFRNYFPICPLVFGRTDPSGDYCLRVRDDIQAARWLVRYTVNGEARFRFVDFRAEGQMVLT